jgi:hypothetical protein
MGVAAENFNSRLCRGYGEPREFNRGSGGFGKVISKQLSVFTDWSVSVASVFCCCILLCSISLVSLANSQAASWEAARAVHNRRGSIHRVNGAGGPCGPPARRISGLLGHGRTRGRDLRFHGIEVEARALLHWREFDSAHGCLCHHFLDEHEAPELVFIPLKIFE